MKQEKLKEITKKANDAVRDLEPELKKIAFETILSKLLESDSNLKEPSFSKRKIKFKKISNPAHKHTSYLADASELMDKIDSTKYPYLFELSSTLDKALSLIKIAKEDCAVDGLIPSQISEILNEKFRIKTKRTAVSMALMKATKYVDRKPVTIQGGKGYVYRIMHAGEIYLTKKLKSILTGEKGD
ncbi:MAG: hypothetical protein ABH849_03370 [Nanoarchaeota archaeon]